MTADAKQRRSKGAPNKRAPITEAHLTKTAPAGITTQVLFWAEFEPDCNPIDAVLTIVKPPKGGDLNLSAGTGFTNYAKENVRAKCNTQRTSGTIAEYRASAGFTGKDTVELKSVDRKGNVASIKIDVTVVPLMPSASRMSMLLPPAAPATPQADPAAKPATEAIETVTSVAASENRTRVRSWWFVNPDCTAERTLVRIVTPPEHGRSEVGDTQVFPSYGGDNPRVKCNSTQIGATGLWYTSNAAYVGADSVVADVFYPSGSYKRVRINIDVK